MNIPEGFTPRGDSNEQPPETYDKMVKLVYMDRKGLALISAPATANRLGWKVPDGANRIYAYKVLP